MNAQLRHESTLVGAPAAGITLPDFEQQAATTAVRSMPSPPPAPEMLSKSNVFVAGILAVDYSCDHQPRSKTASALEMHTSNPASIGQSLGGVGHNVARAASLMGSDVRFCSAVGDDLSGKEALQALSQEGLGSAAVKILPGEASRRTAQYISVNEQNKDLAIAMADMSILNVPEAGEEDVIRQAFTDLWEPQLTESKPTHLVVDANWPPKYLQMWLKAASTIGAHVTFEPVSNAKSTIPFELPAVPGQNQVDSLPAFPFQAISLASPNSYELAAMHTAARERGFFERQDWWEVIDALGIPSTGARVAMAMATSSELVDQGIPQQGVQLLPFIPSICTKLGSKGVLVTQLLKAGDPRLTSGEYAPYILSRCNNDTDLTLGVGGVYMRLFPPSEQVEAADIVSVNGVGDTFVGTLVAQLAKAKSQGVEKGVEECIDIAQKAAVLTLKSSQAVSPDLSALKLK